MKSECPPSLVIYECDTAAVDPAAPSAFVAHAGDSVTTEPDEPLRCTAPDGVAPVTASGAAFHIFKGFVGLGVFVTPSMFVSTGVVPGLVLGVVLGGIMVETLACLVAARQRIAPAAPDALTFPAVVAVVLGPRLHLVTQVALVVSQFGWCLLYLQVAASLLADAFGAASGNRSVYWTVLLAEAALEFTLAMFSNDLDRLASASAVATGALVPCLGVTFVQAAHGLATGGPHPTAVTTAPVVEWIGFAPSFLSAMAAIAVILPVHNAMAPPQQRVTFPWVFRLSASAIAAMYLFYGVVGYLAHGAQVATSLVSLLSTGRFGVVMRCALAAVQLLSFPIQFVPAIELLDAALGIPRKASMHRHREAVLLRCSVCTGLALVAAVLGPDALSLILTMLGSTAVVVINMVIPVLLELAPIADTPSPWAAATWRQRRCVLYLLCGAVVFVGGVAHTCSSVVAFVSA